MNEQDLKKMEDPQVKVMEEEKVYEIEGTPNSKNHNFFHVKKEYQTDEFKRKVLESRSENPPKTWTTIRDELNEEFGTKISSPSVKKIFNQEIARTITIEKKAGKKFNKFDLELETLFYRTIKLMKRLLDNIDDIDNTFEASDMTKIQKQMAFMKMTPAIKQTVDSIFQAIKVQQDQMDKIKLEQKNLVYSDVEIKNKIKEHMTRLIKDGKVKVIRDDPMLPRK